MHHNVSERTCAVALYFNALLPQCGALRGTSARAFLRDVYVARHAPVGAGDAAVVACGDHHRSDELGQ
eukprot:2427399-Prymnesium_polylepis.1